MDGAGNNIAGGMGSGGMEDGRGRRNNNLRSEVRGYEKEERRRGRPGWPRLTLRLDSVGRKQA